jgi:hypothetical protein
MEPRAYPITPPGKFTLLLPMLAVIACVLVLVVVLAIANAPPEQWLHAWPVLVALLVVPFVSWRMGHRSVRLSDEGLRIRSLPWPRTIPVEGIDLERAAVVNLHEHPELQPTMKLAGSRVPGYRAGRFRLRDGRWASVIVTDPQRVLVLPLRSGSVLMLSVERGDALLQALRQRG